MTEAQQKMFQVMHDTLDTLEAAAHNGGQLVATLRAESSRRGEALVEAVRQRDAAMEEARTLRAERNELRDRCAGYVAELNERGNVADEFDRLLNERAEMQKNLDDAVARAQRAEQELERLQAHISLARFHLGDQGALLR